MVHTEVSKYFFPTYNTINCTLYSLTVFVLTSFCICLGLVEKVRLKIVSVRFEGIFGEENFLNDMSVKNCVKTNAVF